MKWGSFEVLALEAGTFALDGGAMFGTIPKTLWSRVFPANEDNQITLATRCLFLRDSERNIVVDSGMGTKWDEKAQKIYKIQNRDFREVILGTTGLKPHQITDLIATHLHFDHCGGFTHRVQDSLHSSPSNTIEASFPHARFWVSQANFQNAQNPNPREKASYLSENWKPYLAQLQLFKDASECEVLPGIHAMPSQGHTRGLSIIRLPWQDTELVYAADLIPTHAHIPLAWIMGYDIWPEKIIEEKRMLLATLANNRGWIFFEHDPRFVASQVKQVIKKDGSIDFVFENPVDCLEKVKLVLT